MHSFHHFFNPLSANVEYTHEGDVTCSRGAFVKSLKMASVFLKEENICYKMVYYTLWLKIQSIGLES